MEKRILGIILSLLGVVGLIYAGVNFMNGLIGTDTIKAFPAIYIFESPQTHNAILGVLS